MRGTLTLGGAETLAIADERQGPETSSAPPCQCREPQPRSVVPRHLRHGCFANVGRADDLAVEYLGIEPDGIVEIAHVVLDDGERGRRAGHRKLGRGWEPRRRSGLLGDLNHDAVRVLRVQERFLPGRIREADLNWLDPQCADSREGLIDIRNDEVQVMRTSLTGSKEALEKDGIGPAGRREQLDLGAGAEPELPPPEAWRVSSVDPRAAEHGAEQLPAIREFGRGNRDMIQDGLSPHGPVRLLCALHHYPDGTDPGVLAVESRLRRRRPTRAPASSEDLERWTRSRQGPTTQARTAEYRADCRATAG